MPHIIVDGPPLEIDRKRKMAQEMTRTAAEAYGLPEDSMVVVITENQPENVCVGGVMVCDRRAREA